jgi:putative integral membrane protein (TIGR02587 family)
VGGVVAAAALALFGVLRFSASPAEVAGQIALLAGPAAIGALLAGKQLSVGPSRENERRAVRSGTAGELFVMLAGALFLALNIAPTEEMALIAFKMSAGQGLLLLVVSVLLMHLFAYFLGFPGQGRRREAGGVVQTALTLTLPGYAIALLASAYCLWTFGRLDGVSGQGQAMMILVLGFPAAMGAATARLVI